MRTTRVIYRPNTYYRARFHNVWYWVFGLWTIEVTFWAAVLLVWLIAVLVGVVRARRFRRG